MLKNGSRITSRSFLFWLSKSTDVKFQSSLPLQYNSEFGYVYQPAGYFTEEKNVQGLSAPPIVQNLCIK